jgi:hypothetical protein
MIDDIIRERKTRERLQKLDIPELIDETHWFEDRLAAVEAERDRLRKALDIALRGDMDPEDQAIIMQILTEEPEKG